MDANDASQKLFDKIMEDYRRDRLVLPSLPDVAMRVRKAVNNPKNTASQIAKIIQIDPALTARLIQISNGPLHRGTAKIENCQMAITRLGFRVVQNLVMSMTFRSMFKARHPIIRRRMEKTWKDSSRIAAVACVLARVSHGLDADRGLIAGVVHQIGVLPILRYADQYPELVTDPEALDRIIDQLRGPLGTLILKKWNFGEDLVELPKEVIDLLRDSGNPVADYPDIVIVAIVHAKFGSEDKYDGPPLNELPAFSKLTLSKLGPGGSIELLKEAQGEIEQIMSLLQG